MNKTHALSPFLLERLAPSLCLEEASEHSELSVAEEEINQVLEDLSNFNIEHNKTPAWVEWGLCVVIIPFMLFMGTSIMWLHWVAPHFVDTGWKVFFVFAITLASMGFAHVLYQKSFAFMRRPHVGKHIVSYRQHLLKKAISYVSSPVLKGRLAEVYFLCDNKNIDVNFWVALDNKLTTFVKQKEGETVGALDVETLRNDYRQSQKIMRRKGGA